MNRDFAASTFPIFSTAAGTVCSIEGGVVTIDYEDGRVARYFHVNDIAVAVGEKVAVGQQIGTGRGW